MITQNGSLDSTQVTLTDQTTGLLLTDNIINPQQSIRPIDELTILTRSSIDQSADYEVIYDASTGNHVRVLATRASQTNYLADGLSDTRAGSIGSINTSIYSAFDHIHPIIAIIAPTAPTITVISGTMAITPLLIATTVTQEESVTFQFRVQCNIPAHTNTWQAFQVPNIAGFKQAIISVTGTYRQTGTPAPSYPAAPYMGNEAALWGGNTIYIGGYTENQATVRYVQFNVTYVIA